MQKHGGRKIADNETTELETRIIHVEGVQWLKHQIGIKVDWIRGLLNKHHHQCPICSNGTYCGRFTLHSVPFMHSVIPYLSRRDGMNQCPSCCSSWSHSVQDVKHRVKHRHTCYTCMVHAWSDFQKVLLGSACQNIRPTTLGHHLTHFKLCHHILGLAANEYGRSTRISAIDIHSDAHISDRHCNARSGVEGRSITSIATTVVYVDFPKCRPAWMHRR